MCQNVICVSLQAEAPEEKPEEEDLRNEVSHIGYYGGRSRVVG